MSKRKILKLKLLSVLSFIFLLTVNVIASKNDLEQIRQAIAEKGANWEVGEGWVSKLSLEDFRKLCGALPIEIDTSIAPLIELPMVDSLPESFDWRNNNGNWVTPVKNQHSPNSCGCCWDFAAVAQVESWWKIHHSNVDSMIDLSEQFILSCGNSGSCSDGVSVFALEDIKNEGIPLEMCFPYQADDQIPCSAVCPNWQDNAIKIPAWGFVTMTEDDIENIKRAVYHQPVSTRFDVYADFQNYVGGVYEHVWGSMVSGHFVLIVGWNDDEQSWICKNSWGEEWGESGYFRIKWGNCGIGSYVPIIWDELRDSLAIVVSPEHFDLSMTVGDSAEKIIMAENSGVDDFQYYLMDFGAKIFFHPDTFNSWDDFSWWCGDPVLDGYDNNRLEFLEVPLLNLTNTASPHLSFMAFWKAQAPTDYINTGYDGWDGCNVWISKNAGKSFEVIDPISPQYDCTSLFSYGFFDYTTWAVPNRVAGWAGNSGGWIPVEFDLTNYISDSVLIRFGFASDYKYCTLDDPNLIGFFIDDIVVSDGTTILFEDDGNNPNSMKRVGQTRADVDWINTSTASNILHPNEAAPISAFFKTRTLSPGEYFGHIMITNNITDQFWKNVSFNLHLNAPNHDISVEKINTQNIPIFVAIRPEVGIRNFGLNDESNVGLECIISNQGQMIFHDTTFIDILPANKLKEVQFKSFMGNNITDFEMTVTLLNLSEDYNAFNNSITSTLNCTNLIDDFETKTDHWYFEGGWGITDKFKGCSSDFAAHVNSGVTPYSNNMNATMTFTPGFEFDLQSVIDAKLTFRTKYYTEENKDFCYVELSGDSINWSKADSISGMNTRTWALHEVVLSDFIQPEIPKVWFRFRFVSDSAETKTIGILIDDVEIYPTTPTQVEYDISTVQNPKIFALEQNYPNPFNPTTTISYQLPVNSYVEITIFSITGQKIETLISEQQQSGFHKFVWDGRDVASGVYFYRLSAVDATDKGKGFVETMKLVLLK